jgi:class I fructose-bisphosphate aldolase
MVVFSGGEAKDLEGLFTEIRGMRDGGANGSIIGRNTFQRPRDQALDVLDKIIGIYQGKKAARNLALRPSRSFAGLLVTPIRAP